MKKTGVLLLIAILPVCSLAATEIYNAKITYKIINKTTNVIAYQKSEASLCEATEGSSGLSYFDAAPAQATFSTPVGQCMSDYSSSGLSFSVADVFSGKDPGISVGSISAQFQLINNGTALINTFTVKPASRFLMSSDTKSITTKAGDNPTVVITISCDGECPKLPKPSS